DPDPAHAWNRMWQMFYAVPVPADMPVGPEELDLPVANQDVFEFRLRRKHLFAGRNGGLRAVEVEEKDYSNSIALFGGAERRPLNPPAPSSIIFCGSCHAGRGIFSG